MVEAVLNLLDGAQAGEVLERVLAALPVVPVPLLAGLYALLVVLLAGPLLEQTYRRSLMRRRLARREARPQATEAEEPSAGLEQWLRQAGVNMSPRTFLAASAGAGLAAYALAVVLGIGGPVSVLAGLTGLALPYVALRERAAGRVRRMEEDLVQALPQMAGAARLRPPVEVLLTTAADSLAPDSPLAAELRRLRAEMAVRPAQEVLREWEATLPPGGVRELAILLRIYAHRGGEHAEVFADSAERVIRFQELRARAVAKAQGNLNVARILPLLGLVVLFFSLRQPAARAFYTSPAGQLLLVLLGAWMALGYLVLKRMVDEIR